MSGIVPIVDQIGGDMTVPEDYTAIDPVFVQGSTITLNGELTEKYIRSVIHLFLEVMNSVWSGRLSLYRRFWRK